MSRTTLRPALAAVSLIVALVAAVVVPAASASASAHRYWGYFQLQGSSWALPQGTGPGHPSRRIGRGLALRGGRRG